MPGSHKAKTAARGLGAAHQRARKQLPAPEGEPCPFCGEPMLPGQALDADHARPRALGGTAGELRWAHARCNARAGAQLGNALRGRGRPKWTDRWS